MLESKASALINSITFSPFTQLLDSHQFQTEPRARWKVVKEEKAAAANPMGVLVNEDQGGTNGLCFFKEKRFTNHHWLTCVAPMVQVFRKMCLAPTITKRIVWLL